MKIRQLNVWISEDLRGHIVKRAEQETCYMNDIIAELIRDDIAKRNGQFVERNSLIVLQEIVAAEIRYAHVQLRGDLRSDWQQETASLFERFQRSFDRLVGLVVIVVRTSSMI